MRETNREKVNIMNKSARENFIRLKKMGEIEIYIEKDRDFERDKNEKDR